MSQVCKNQMFISDFLSVFVIKNVYPCGRDIRRNGSISPIFVPDLVLVNILGFVCIEKNRMPISEFMSTLVIQLIFIPLGERVQKYLANNSHLHTRPESQVGKESNAYFAFSELYGLSKFRPVVEKILEEWPHISHPHIISFVGRNIRMCEVRKESETYFAIYQGYDYSVSISYGAVAEVVLRSIISSYQIYRDK